MKRRTFIKKSGMMLGTMAVSPVLGNIDAIHENDFPLMDLHVHTTRQFTIEHVMDIAKKKRCSIRYC
ncbi:MAG: hypothetical protein H8D56_10115 [Planctomycetes bacterium]|nr:hypothetical protein [Planctomycetota bacterium]MBL7145703.1 hypothetical protein [Phycisphaerae bacterium]